MQHTFLVIALFASNESGFVSSQPLTVVILALPQMANAVSPVQPTTL